MFLRLVTDDLGTTTTYICEACPAGQQQPAAGANDCEACPTGTSKRVASVESCVPCASGFYQDEEGTTSCKRCPEKTTTLLQGAATASDCVCMAGTIDVSPTPSKECVACGEGLSCPDGGTLDLLKTGQNDTAVPEVLSSYFSTQEAPLSIYKCPLPHCPGGRPGTCQGGRVGLTCAECPESTYWADDACVACEVSVRVYWIVGIIAVFFDDCVLLHHRRTLCGPGVSERVRRNKHGHDFRLCPELGNFGSCAGQGLGIG